MHREFYIRLISREHPLPEAFVPEHLIDIGLPFEAAPGDPKRLLEYQAAKAASQLFHACHRCGLNLWAVSGYRSYQRQKELFTGSPFVAEPGTRAPERTCSGCILPFHPYGALRKVFRNRRRPLAEKERSALWFYPPVPKKQRGDHRHPLRAMAHPLCDQTSGFLAHYHKSDSGRILLLSFPVSAPSLICSSWHLHLMFIS